MTDYIVGIALTIIAYGTLWYFVLLSRKVIDKIATNKLSNIREIKRELGYRKEKNG